MVSVAGDRWCTGVVRGGGGLRCHPPQPEPHKAPGPSPQTKWRLAASGAHWQCEATDNTVSAVYVQAHSLPHSPQRVPDSVGLERVDTQVVFGVHRVRVHVCVCVCQVCVCVCVCVCERDCVMCHVYVRCVCVCKWVFPCVRAGRWAQCRENGQMHVRSQPSEPLMLTCNCGTAPTNLQVHVRESTLEVECVKVAAELVPVERPYEGRCMCACMWV